MSKYTFMDGHGNEQPMPPKYDTDEAQYDRGFTGGSWPTDDPIMTDEISRIAHAHDMKCEAFRRGWEDGIRALMPCFTFRFDTNDLATKAAGFGTRETRLAPAQHSDEPANVSLATHCGTRAKAEANGPKATHTKANAQ